MLAQAALSTQTSPSKWSLKLVKLQSRDSQALWGSHPQAGMLRRFCGILLSAWRIGGDSGSLMGRSLEVGAQLTNAVLAFTGNTGDCAGTEAHLLATSKSLWRPSPSTASCLVVEGKPESLVQ